MTVSRVTLNVPSADAASTIRLARQADAWGLDGVWVGDPLDRSLQSDAWTATVAGAVAAVTSSLRIGTFFDLSDPARDLRVAEDIGVVDQLSAGRIDVAFIDGGTPTWSDRVDALLASWTGFDVGARVLAVTPPPLQPQIDRLVAAPSDAGFVAEGGRRVVSLDVSMPSGPGGLVAALAGDPEAAVRSWRDAVAAAGAGEVAIRPSVDRGSIEPLDLKTIAMFVSPMLRCCDWELPSVLVDSWSWLTERSHLHAATPH